MDDFIYKLDPSTLPSDLPSGGGLATPNSNGLSRDAVNGLISEALRTQTERMIMANGTYQSQNFVTGSAGWQIDALGNAEFQNGTFRGNISATTGTIGGFTIGATTISATGLVISSTVPSITVGTGASTISINGSTGVISGTGFSINGNGTITGFTPRWTNGSTTKNSADASTTQNIAHGLGQIPSFVEIIATYQGNANTNSNVATTFYNGTTQSSSSVYGVGNNNAQGQSFILNGGQNAATGNNTGVVTFDATNIIITWTLTGAPTGTYDLLWKTST